MVGRRSGNARSENTIQADDLRSLCKGYSPAGTPLIQNAGASDHQEAWDLTFSAPKSVSVLWSQVEPEIRSKIEALHQQAIQAALEHLSKVALFTRRGKGGHIRESAFPVVAIFPHASSRELEPQLHSHCVLLNVAARADGTYGTILSEPFYRYKLTAGAIYQLEFAYLLQTELELAIEQESTSFGLVGVPKALINRQSTRSKQIQNQIGPKGQRSAKAAAMAALDTRKAKPDRPPPRSDLFRRWHLVNLSFGFTRERAQQLLGKAKPIAKLPNLPACIAQAIEELLESHAFFSEQLLIRAVAKQQIGRGIPADDVIREVRNYLNTNPEIMTLGLFDQEIQYTTHQMWALEQKLLTAIDQGKSDTSHVIKSSLVNRVLDQRLPIGPQLPQDDIARNTEQRKAVVQLTTNPGDVSVLEGMAGAGKTYTLSVVREIYEKAGYRVTGVAPSAVAACNLQEGSGAESTTLARRLLQLNRRSSFKRHHQRQIKRFLKGERTYAYDGRSFSFNKKDVVLFDESGMSGTRDWAEFLEHVRHAGAKLIAVGHRCQLQPIDAGGPFAAIADRTDAAQLEHVTRQKIEPDDPNPTWHRQAGKLIAAGQVEQAIKLFAERGRFSIHEDRDDAILNIVRDWSVGGMANPDDHVILASTKAEVAQLNAMCQEARLESQTIGSESIRLADGEFWIGDTVVFRKNSRLYQVKNGDRGIVLAFNPSTRTMAVRLAASGTTVIIPYREYTDIQLGYAVTTHVAQGATIPNIYVLLGGPMQDRHLSYVQTTRACESTRLYADKYTAGPKRRHLLQQMAQLRPKLLAHDLTAANDTNPAPESPKPQTELEVAADKNLWQAELQEQIAKLREAASGEPQPPQSKILQDQSPPKNNSAYPGPSGIAKPKKKRGPRKSVVSFNSNDKPVERVSEPLPPKQATDPPPASLPRVQQPSNSPATPDFPRRVPDSSSLNINMTTDEQILRQAIVRYGKLPGGIVVEGHARSEIPIRSLTFDVTRPTALRINGTLAFDTRLSPEETALIWDAVLETAQAADDFGALSQQETIGIDNDTTIGANMMRADNFAGGIVYGYDSQFVLGKSHVASYSNPLLEETGKLGRQEVITRLCFNNLYDLVPQFFLKATDTSFASPQAGVFAAISTNVTAAIGVVGSGGGIVTALPAFPGKSPLVADRFPEVYRTFRHFAEHFADYRLSEVTLARAMAYAELILLLRLARMQNASLSGREHARQLVAQRQHLVLPRFDYTLRSHEYASAIKTAAESLRDKLVNAFPVFRIGQEIRFEPWNSDVKRESRLLTSQPVPDEYQCLTIALLGCHYANRAGDPESHSMFKQIALNSIAFLRSSSLDLHPSIQQRELRRLLPAIEKDLESTCHDFLIQMCVNKALQPNRSAESKLDYLNNALRNCGPEQVVRMCAATRCRRAEIRSLLDESFNPLPELAAVRADHPGIWQPFHSLDRIQAHRSKLSSATQILDPYADEIAQILQDYADAFLLVHAYTRKFPSTKMAECLFRFRSQHADNAHIQRAASELIAFRLKDLPLDSFSTRLLHPDNPFCSSHGLLDLESPNSLATLFAAIRPKIENFAHATNVVARLTRFVSNTFGPADAESWWRLFLKSYATHQNIDASKTALLSAHELALRGRTVEEVYERMGKYDIKNPQAVLFLFDYEKASTGKLDWGIENWLR
jgi:conjugative relaxase-like TrwC/TraI family protein